MGEQPTGLLRGGEKGGVAGKRESTSKTGWEQGHGVCQEELMLLRHMEKGQKRVTDAVVHLKLAGGRASGKEQGVTSALAEVEGGYEVHGPQLRQQC